MRFPLSRSTALRIGVSAGLLALLFWKGGVGFRQMAAVLGGADLVDVTAAFLLYGVAGTVVRALRWRRLVVGLDQELSLRRATEIFLVGVTFNQVLPTGIGGDVVRTVWLGREGMGRARAASTVLVERATGMLALLAVGLVAVLFAGDMPPVVVVILSVAGVFGLVGMALLTQAEMLRLRAARLPLVGRVADHPGIARFVDSFADYGPAPLLAAFGWSVVFAGIMVGTNMLLGRAFGISQAGLWDWAVVVPLIALSLLVPSIGGLGPREWSYVGLLAALSPPVAPETATALSLTFHGLNLLLAIVGGLVVLAAREPVRAMD